MSIIAIGGELHSGKDTVAKMIQYYFWCKNLEFKKLNQTIDLSKFLKNYYKHKLYYEECEQDNRNKHLWQIKKFASKLKLTISQFTGCTLEQLEDSDFKENVCYNVTTGQIKHINDLFGKIILYTEVQSEYEENSWITFCVVLQDIGMKLRSSIPQIHINGLFSKYNEIFDLLSNPEAAIGNFPNWIISDLRLLNEAKAVKDRNGITIKITRSSDKKGTHISESQLHSIQYDWYIHNDSTIESLYNKVVDTLKKFNLCSG